MGLRADWNLEVWFNQIGSQDRIKRHHDSEPLGVLTQRQLQLAQNAIQFLWVIGRDSLRTQVPYPILKRQHHGGPGHDTATIPRFVRYHTYCR